RVTYEQGDGRVGIRRRNRPEGLVLSVRAPSDVEPERVTASVIFAPANPVGEDPNLSAARLREVEQTVIANLEGATPDNLAANPLLERDPRRNPRRNVTLVATDENRPLGLACAQPEAEG